MLRLNSHLASSVGAVGGLHRGVARRLGIGELHRAEVGGEAEADLDRAGVVHAERAGRVDQREALHGARLEAPRSATARRAPSGRGGSRSRAWRSRLGSRCGKMRVERLLLKSRRRVDGAFARRPARPSTLNCLPDRPGSGAAPAAQFRCRSPKASRSGEGRIMAAATQRQAFRPSGTVLDLCASMPASVFSSPDAGFSGRLPRRLSQSSPVSVVLAGDSEAAVWRPSAIRRRVRPA